MPNIFFNNTIDLLPFTKVRASAVEANLSAVEAGFDGVVTALATRDAAIALRAPIANPSFTGVPRAPTAPVGTATTQLATTAYADAAVAATFALVPPGSLPSVAGQAGRFLKTDGTSVGWDSVGPQMLVITSTQTWTPPVGVTRAKVTVIGGGGASGFGQTYQGQGGGGGGGSAVSVLTVSSATTYTATIGAGGSSGAVGGASSFAGSGITTITANGGQGGQGMTSGVGGTATGGQINIPGGSGNGSPANTGSPPPHGGETLLSPRTVSPINGGLAGQGFGSGGVAAFGGATPFSGAAGVIVIEF